ncbi:MAG TPA: DUF4013 domain-containing protein [Candidatus Dormibacteraeota bacterium]
MDDLVEAIKWPTYDPEWVKKIILMSLITIIPIVGALVLLGWMLTCLDYIRAGRNEMPPAGFGYIGRGLPLFVVGLVYGLALGVVWLALFIIGTVIAAAGGSNNSGLGAIGGLFFLLATAWLIVGLLAAALAAPAIILSTERSGIPGGLNVPGIIALIRQNIAAAVLAAVSFIVASVIGSIGGVVCALGVYLTIAYGYAMMARIIRGYEIQLGQAAAPAVQGGSV